MASRKSLKILGISGSLRHGSSNSGLIRSAAASAARLNQSTQDYHINFQIYQRLKDIPLYDGDVEAKAMPESVVHFCQAIAEADALLIATPEYNYSVSGVLKNAIDWASRPYRRTPLTGKPVAILGAGGVSGNVTPPPLLLFLPFLSLRKQGQAEHSII
jgi:chromate reductase